MKSVHPSYAVWQPQVPERSSVPMVQNLSELWQVNSLTLALKALSPHFSVTLLTLDDTQAYPDEVGFDVMEPLFCREVTLSLEGNAVVWARSVCQKNSQHWLPILDCGTQPLGHRLFDGSLPISRSPFEYALVPTAHPMLPASVIDFASSVELGARRSTFWWGEEALLLTECFLPAIEEYL